MDPGEGSEHRFSENHSTLGDSRGQARDKPQGKKYRAGAGQGASRAKQRAPGNLSTNGICHTNSSEPNFNNNSLGSAKFGEPSDPYSVSYNVDSKTSIDKCISDRSGDGFPGCCGWSLEGILGQADTHSVKINNTETEVNNGTSAPASSLNINNLEMQFRPNEQNSEPSGKLGLLENSRIGGNQNNFNINVPSTSGSNGVESEGCAGVARGSTEAARGSTEAARGSAGGTRGSRKRSAQSCRKRREVAERPVPYADDSSSDTGNDDYSVGSDECCIYTYRGGEHLADLPSSFFSLDMGLAEAALPAPPLFAPRLAPPSRDSSPDMDYLEMDFDPGPSCEADSDRESSLDLDLDAAQPEDEHSENENSLPSYVPEVIETDMKVIENQAPILSKPAVEPVILPTVASVSTPITVTLDVPEPSMTVSTTTRGLSPVPSTSGTCYRQPAEVVKDEMQEEEKEEIKQVQVSGSSLISHALASGEMVLVRRTCRSWPAREGPGHHSSSGDLISPGDAAECELPESLLWAPMCSLGGGGGLLEASNFPESGKLALDAGRSGADPRASLLEAGRHNLASALFHCTMAKRLTVHRTDNFLHDQDTSNVDIYDGVSVERPLNVPKTMVWSEQEACCRQLTQIGTSACGATAVINALLGLNQPVEVERVLGTVATRLRACAAPLPRYLISRALAGCAATALAAGLRTQHVFSRHFRTWPERALSLSHYLAFWIGLGAVPILTLNLQAGVLDPARTPDSWHHQMVFGVGPRGVYLTNPLECVEEGILWHQLCSDSVLLVRRKDIVSRWTCDTDLSPLLHVPGDMRWRTMNVLGQVVNVIRESHTSSVSTRTSHVRIPACYEAGITIAAVFGSEAHRRLLHAPELPLLEP